MVEESLADFVSEWFPKNTGRCSEGMAWDQKRIIGNSGGFRSPGANGRPTVSNTTGKSVRNNPVFPLCIYPTKLTNCSSHNSCVICSTIICYLWAASGSIWTPASSHPVPKDKSLQPILNTRKIQDQSVSKTHKHTPNQEMGLLGSFSVLWLLKTHACPTGEGFTGTVRSRLSKQDYICENPMHAWPADCLAFISHLTHKAFKVVRLFLCLMAKYQIISEAGHIISSLNTFINRVFVRPI